MSQLVITSDSHHGHKNIIEYESRPFRDVDEMDSVLIHKWNKKISPQDRVIFLGDFCLRNRAYYERILSQLNYGSMLWIKGNHDKGLKTLNEFPRVFAVKNAIIEIPGLGDVFLTHEPVGFPGWYDGVDVVLHGHIHQREGGDVIRVKDNMTFFHVGVDTNNFRPWHSNEIGREIKTFLRSLK